jgi:hypothetical protein
MLWCGLLRKDIVSVVRNLRRALNLGEPGHILEFHYSAVGTEVDQYCVNVTRGPQDEHIDHARYFRLGSPFCP